jgi:hypothetical protein
MDDDIQNTAPSVEVLESNPISALAPAEAVSTQPTGFDQADTPSMAQESSTGASTHYVKKMTVWNQLVVLLYAQPFVS